MTVLVFQSLMAPIGGTAGSSMREETQNGARSVIWLQRQVLLEFDLQKRLGVTLNHCDTPRYGVQHEKSDLHPANLEFANFEIRRCLNYKMEGVKNTSKTSATPLSSDGRNAAELHAGGFCTSDFTPAYQFAPTVPICCRRLRD